MGALAALARGGSGELQPEDHRSDLIHYSTLPWVAFTSISHARHWGREDSVPKITFGRATERDGRWQLPVSVEVHHALMDGLHVGRFFERLQRSFAEPEAALAGRAGGVPADSPGPSS